MCINVCIQKAKSIKNKMMAVNLRDWHSIYYQIPCITEQKLPRRHSV